MRYKISEIWQDTDITVVAVPNRFGRESRKLFMYHGQRARASDVFNFRKVRLNFSKFDLN